MWLLPALGAPLVMLLALLAQRRAGSEAAGLVGAMPMTMPIAMLAVGASLGAPSASAFALAAAAHVPAQVVFGVAFATAMRRLGPAAGIASGVAAFAAASWALSPAPGAAAVALAVPALAAGPAIMKRTARDAGRAAEARRPGVLLTCAAAGIVVAAVLAVVRYGGPVAGGLFAALPALSATLALAVARSSGRDAGAEAVTGMVRGLPAYFAFVLAAGLIAPVGGAVVAVVAGLGASVVTGLAAWRRAVAARPPVGPRAASSDLRGAARPSGQELGLGRATK